MYEPFNAYELNTHTEDFFNLQYSKYSVPVYGEYQVVNCSVVTHLKKYTNNSSSFPFSFTSMLNTTLSLMYILVFIVALHIKPKRNFPLYSLN